MSYNYRLLIKEIMMNITKKTCCTALLLSTLVLSSCANYRATSLNNNLVPEFCPSGEAKEEIAVAAKAFTLSDCKQYLDRDVISEGYQPIQLSIQNNSTKTLGFSLSGVSLPHVPATVVAETVHTSTAARVAAYGVGSLIIWPLIIPAIVDGLKSSEANDRLDNDFIAKEAKDQILYPHGRMNSLIFVPVKDYTKSFTVTLIDKETNQPELRVVNLSN